MSFSIGEAFVNGHHARLKTRCPFDGGHARERMTVKQFSDGEHHLSIFRKRTIILIARCLDVCPTVEPTEKPSRRAPLIYAVYTISQDFS